MARIGPDDSELDEAEQMAQRSDDVRTGWSQTIEDMRAMAENRREAGYEALTLQAGNTAPIAPEQGESADWGLFHVIPGDDAEAFRDLVQRADFEETGVYQASIGRDTFLVTECIDHDAELVLLIAGSYTREAAPELVRAAMDRGRLYTHVKTLDGTILGTIEHDDPAAFFPDPDAIFAYEHGE
ncbi:MAG: hypothetical protein ABEJ84_06045 [Halodesulfurarchaeum sp.]